MTFTRSGERSDCYGKDRLNCMRVLWVHRIYMWLLDLRKACAANVAIEWLLRKNFKQHYIDTESENQKSG